MTVAAEVGGVFVVAVEEVVVAALDDAEEGDADLSSAASLGVRVLARFILFALLLQWATRAESRTCHVLTSSHDSGERACGM